MHKSLALLMSLMAVILAGCGVGSAAESAVKIPPPQLYPVPVPGQLDKVVLAGGCFWGVQGVFQHLKGVKNVLSGYAGGDRATANYSSREPRRYRACRSGGDSLRP